MRTTLPPEALDRTDRLLINRLQDGLPLTHAPFAAVEGRVEGLAVAEIEISRHLRAGFDLRGASAGHPRELGGHAR